MLVTFNYYFETRVGSEWIPPTGHNNDVWVGKLKSSSGYETTWVQDAPGYMKGTTTINKLTLLADNVSNSGIMVGGNWCIQVKHIFVVSNGSGSLTSPTLYTDQIKLKKMNCLHYRDQTFMLYFAMASGYVTETANQFYFQIIDKTVINYYNTLVNKHFPPLTREMDNSEITTRELKSPITENYNKEYTTPTMINLIEPSGIVTSNCDDGTAWLAFDQKIGQSWEANYPPVSLMYDFEKESKIINKYALQKSISTKSANFPSTWTLEGSNNFTSTANDLQGTNGWTILDSKTNIKFPTTDYGWTDYFTFNNTIPYQKYRIYITRTCQNTGNVPVILSQLKLISS